LPGRPSHPYNDLFTTQEEMTMSRKTRRLSPFFALTVCACSAARDGRRQTDRDGHRAGNFRMRAVRTKATLTAAGHTVKVAARNTRPVTHARSKATVICFGSGWRREFRRHRLRRRLGAKKYFDHPQA
jgi:hypothetical protein